MYDEEMTKKFGMLIPTRNRPEEIRSLLKSLLGQGIEQIVICSSGDDLTRELSEFFGILPITHIVAEPGQINQKMIGMKHLVTNLDWVIFSDDDVCYPGDFLLNVSTFIDTHESADLLGVGFQIESLVNVKKSILKTIFCTIFRLQIGKPGSVQENGECISYMQSNSALATNWLNGASVWRLSEVLKYESPDRFTKYAAYEDAIFSHRRSKYGQLLYSPELRIKYSHPEKITKLNDITFRSNCLWKLYFVLEFQLSLVKFVWSNIGFTLQFIISTGSEVKKRRKLESVLSVWTGIFRVCLSKNPKSEVLDLLKNLGKKA